MHSSMPVPGIVDPGFSAALPRLDGGQAQPTPASRASTLGIVARFASAPKLDTLSGRVRRFMVQAGARELLPEERVAHCLRRPIPGAAGVQVLYSPARKAAHYGGLMVCGSVWACPVCSAKISERRREELSAAISAWGGQLVLCTFTLQHSAADGLSGLLDDLQGAVRKMRSGRAWMAFQERHGVAGTIRALEVTDGLHGFHPHQHVLFFVSPGVDLDAFTRELRDRWLASVAKVGRYASPRWGLDVRSSDAQIAEYVAKWGKEPKWTTAHELAKTPAKRGRRDGMSMLQLLEAFVLYGEAGWADVGFGQRWREYALVFKGKKQLVWSKGLRALLGLGVEEKTDLELVEEVVEDAVCLALIDLAGWRIVLANDARGELLDVASTGDAGEVRRFLLGLGVEVNDDG